ncbi:MAG: ribosomal RNA small subunit methyltransferase A [Elusimicrobiaceae bacterium]|nr:ribosomal RNA small subunit methyltransferase A [Elusimicrobiaceae bacterium]
MRKYGQHFLVNQRIIDGIVSAVPVGAESVVEIGPGRGALTEKLLQKNFAQFSAVEIDPDMQAYLLAHFPAISGHIVREDFLKFDLSKLPARSTFFVSNLPYIDAAEILDKVLAWPHFAGAVFMFQKEQAQRILARAGQKGYGPLSILTQVRARPALLLKVGKACFNPPPKVESAVLTFEKIAWQVSPEKYTRFAQLIKAAFLHRRKTLFNSLSLAGYDKEKIQAALSALQLPVAVRAEDIPLRTFLKFFEIIIA